MAAMQHTELHFTPARLLLLLWWNQHPQQSMSQFWCRQCLSTHFHRQVSRLAHLSQYISRQVFQFTVQTVFTFYSYELFQFPKFLHPDTAAWSCLTWRTQGNPFCEILAKHPPPLAPLMEPTPPTKHVAILMPSVSVHSLSQASQPLGSLVAIHLETGLPVHCPNGLYLLQLRTLSIPEVSSSRHCCLKLPDMENTRQSILWDLGKHIKKTSIRVTCLTAFVFQDTGKKKFITWVTHVMLSWLNYTLILMLNLCWHKPCNQQKHIFIKF